MNKLLKFSGIIRITKKSINFELHSYDTETIFIGGFCTTINNNKIIACNYIPGIINAHFYSYRELNELSTDDDSIDWDTSHKLVIHSMSKMWDYIQFIFSNVEELSSTFINFPKINKIEDIFSEETTYKSYGNSNQDINIFNFTKINMIHDLLPKQSWILSDLIESYCGSIIYRIDDESKLKILGFTSSNYNGYTRIVPLKYLLNNDIFINLSLIDHQFTDDEIMNMDNPIINKTGYPKLLEDYDELKKDDIIIQINDKHIFDCHIHHNTINEYLTYQKKIIRFCIIRSLVILDIAIHIDNLVKRFPNKIYFDILQVSEHFTELEFNTDIGDLLLENEIYNKDMAKYLENLNHLILEIIL